MKYILFLDKRKLPNDSFSVYIEAEEDGYEERRVSIYDDHRAICSSESMQLNIDYLGEYKWGSVEKFNQECLPADKNGEAALAVEISQEHFEAVWSHYFSM